MATLTLKKRPPLHPHPQGLFAVVQRRPIGHTMRFTIFHTTKESAFAEAERLAKLSIKGNEYLVMEVVQCARCGDES